MWTRRIPGRTIEWAGLKAWDKGPGFHLFFSPSYPPPKGWPLESGVGLSLYLEVKWCSCCRGAQAGTNQPINDKGYSLFLNMDTPSYNGKIQSVFRLSSGSSWKPYLFLCQLEHLPIFTFFFMLKWRLGGLKDSKLDLSSRRDIKGCKGSFK